MHDVKGMIVTRRKEFNKFTTGLYGDWTCRVMPGPSQSVCQHIRRLSFCDLVDQVMEYLQQGGVHIELAGVNGRALV